jgi:hypothetical protein
MSLRTEVDSHQKINSDFGFYIPFDEFNTLIYSNLLAKYIKNTHPEIKLTTCTFKCFENLYSYFDELLFFEWNSDVSPIDAGAQEPDLRAHFDQVAKKMLLERGLSQPKILDSIEENLNKSYGKEIHKKVFGLLAEHLAQSGALITSNENNRLQVHQFLQSNKVEKDFVVVIGRHRKVHEHHNNYLLPQIIDSLKEGKYVINATFPSPKLESYFTKNYLEVSNPMNNYGFTVALMELASMCYVYGNAGGVSIHMMTNSSLTLVGPINWVNSIQFSHKGVTLLAARKIAGLKTHHNWKGTRAISYLKSSTRLSIDFVNYWLKRFARYFRKHS